MSLNAPRLAPAMLPTLMAPLTRLVISAACAIRAVDRSALATAHKADQSPVTRADMAAHDVLVAGARALMPGLPVVSEEDAAALSGPIAGSFVLIDPLDGTREFVAGSDEYAVNLAVITDGAPLLGVVAAPARGLVWRGLVGQGAERLSFLPDGTPGEATPIACRRQPSGGPRVMVSRSHGDDATNAYIATLDGATRESMGSALKFCRVAEGSADIYPRLGPTSEWDVAAGHALVVAAGGTMTSGSGELLRYGQRPDGFGMPNFIARGDPTAGA